MPHADPSVLILASHWSVYGGRQGFAAHLIPVPCSCGRRGAGCSAAVGTRDQPSLDSGSSTADRMPAEPNGSNLTSSDEKPDQRVLEASRACESDCWQSSRRWRAARSGLSRTRGQTAAALCSLSWSRVAGTGRLRNLLDGLGLSRTHCLPVFPMRGRNLAGQGEDKALVIPEFPGTGLPKIVSTRPAGFGL
jgi:hypothetical protein